jgi:hypothetical protein
MNPLPSDLSIDKPKFVEVTIAGSLKFLVVMDDEDNEGDFATQFQKYLNRSADWHVVTNPIRG